MPSKILTVCGCAQQQQQQQQQLVIVEFEPVTKKRINIGFGTCPKLSLANARKKSVEARELLAQGIDPKMQRNTLNEAKRAETAPPFENVATA